MTGFVLRRLTDHAVRLAVVACLAYPLAASVLDPRGALRERDRGAGRAAVEARLGELNLSDRTPVPERFVTWASGVPRGDLGRTLDGVPVGAELRRRVGASLRLLLPGTALGGVLGVASGAYAAARRHAPGARLITLAALAVSSVPVFVTAVLLQLGAQCVDDRAAAGLLAWAGAHAPGEAGGFLTGLAGRLRHLVPPLLTVALAQAAVVGRYQRSTMLDALHAGFVRTATAKGLRSRRTLTRHALRVAVIPMVPLSGYAFAGLVAGAACVEQIFGVHGVGEWLIESIRRDDVNAVTACCCVVAALTAAAGLGADLLTAALDPRVRAGAAR